MYNVEPTECTNGNVHVHVGCAVLLCLVCLFDLASFFLPSHLSFKNMYMYVHMEHVTPVCTCTCTCIHVYVHMPLTLEDDLNKLIHYTIGIRLEDDF